MAKSFRDQNQLSQLFAFAALHALEYGERLFYLEEVEEIRIADERVCAGRTLHIELAEEESEEHLNIELSDEDLGIAGRLDAVRRRDGPLVCLRAQEGEGLP